MSIRLRRMGVVAVSVLLPALQVVGETLDLPPNLEVPGTAQGYVSGVESVERPGDGEYKAQKVLVPNGKRIDSPWSDQRFAVFFPFKLDAPLGEPTGVVAAVAFKGFRDRAMWHPIYNKPDELNQFVESWGVTRLDSDQWHNGIEAGVIHEYRLVPVRAGERTYGYNRGRSPVIYRLNAPTNDTRYQLFDDKRSRRYFDVRIEFPADAERGTYALWFIMDSRAFWSFANAGGITGSVPATIDGSFHAAFIRMPDFADKSYAHVAAGLDVPAGWQYAERLLKKPEIFLKFKRLEDVVVNVKTRRNGWVVKSSKIKDDISYMVRRKGDLKTFSGSAAGNTITARTSAVWHDRSGKETGREEHTYSFIFPEKFLDYSQIEIKLEAEPPTNASIRPGHYAEQGLFAEDVHDKAESCLPWGSRPQLSVHGGQGSGSTRIDMLPPSAPLEGECLLWSVGIIGYATGGITYVRLSDASAPGGAISGAAVTPEVEPESKDDGFYAWLEKFHRQKTELQSSTQEARVKLSTLNKESKTLREQNLRLRALYEEGKETWGPKALEVNLKKRASNRAQMQANRAEQQQIINTASKAWDEIIKDADAQARRSPRRIPRVSQTVLYLKDQRDLAKLDQYDAAAWYAQGELDDLIDALDFRQDKVGEIARLMDAKMKLARADYKDDVIRRLPNFPQGVSQDRLQRIQDLRTQAHQTLIQILGKNPSSQRARLTLISEEFKYLKWITDKLQRERTISLEGFRNYLEKRGFDVEQPETWYGSAWEIARQSITLGPATLMGGLPGIGAADAMSQSNITEQADLVRDHVSLMYIMRLLKGGLTLAEVRKLTKEKLAERLEVRRGNRTRLDPHEAWPITQDIHRTFASLAELGKLAEGDYQGFMQAYNQDYYGRVNTDQSWTEWGLDLFSPVNLLTLFGPSAIAKVNGKWVTTVTRMTGAEIRGLEAAGKLQRGRDVLSATVSSSKLGQWVANRPSAQALGRALERDADYLKDLKGWKKFTSVGARMGAAFVFWGGSAYLAEQSGIPGAVLLVNLLSELHGQEIVSDLLAKSGQPISKLATRVDDLFDIVRYERIR